MHAPLAAKEKKQQPAVAAVRAPDATAGDGPQSLQSVGLPLFLQAGFAASGDKPGQGGLWLQRKCSACGAPAAVVDEEECPECSRKHVPVQTKLSVGEPGDVYEREADRVADQVLAMPAQPRVSPVPPRIQRYTGPGAAGAGSAPGSVERVLSGSGRPLEPELRQDMEQRFGHDFSRVRVHTGATAEQSTLDVNAYAYAVGHDIVFGAGQFTPGSRAGRRLLAHELTHVVQQSGSAGINPDKPGVSLIGTSGSRRAIARQRADERGVKTLEVTEKVLRGDADPSDPVQSAQTSAVQQIPDDTQPQPLDTPPGLKTPGGTTPAPGFHAVVDIFDNFKARSANRLGVGEQVMLSWTSVVSSDAKYFGGLQWVKESGDGTLASNPFAPSAVPNGQASFTAGAITKPGHVKLSIRAGTRADFVMDVVEFDIQPPTGLTMEMQPGSMERNTGPGTWGFLVLGDIRVQPTDVSFTAMQFKEGDALSSASGYFKVMGLDGQMHCTENLCRPAKVGAGDAVRGCHAATDHNGVGMPNRKITNNEYVPFTAGTWIWDIPWELNLDGTNIFTMNSAMHASCDTQGDITYQKANMKIDYKYAP